MGLAEIQRALARLYVNAFLRDRFFDNPDSVGIELGLDPQESRELAGLSRRQVEQFAGSLRRKRRDQVRRILSIASTALGDRFGLLFERYIDQAPPRGSKADLDDAIGFVDAMQTWTDDDRPPWVVDLARYELAWRQALLAGRKPVVRAFRFPVARMVRDRRFSEPITPTTTLALWWRPTGQGRIRHIAITWPGLGRIQKKLANHSNNRDHHVV